MTRLHLPVALLVAAIAVGADSKLSGAAGTRTITVKDDVFAPKRATIARNTFVTFRWARGSGDHDVTSRGKRRFRSSAIKSNGTHRVRFTRAGTYNYVCTLHEGKRMTGRILVR